MAIRLKQELVDKIKADFPGLSINQIAGKYGVAWGTVSTIVGPRKDTKAPRAARRRGPHEHNGKFDTEALVNAWWNSLSLERKASLLMRGE